VVPDEAGERYDLDREDVGRRDRSEMSLDERHPRRSLAAQRRWVDAVLLQDPLDRVAADVEAVVPQRASEPGVSPSRVLLGHLEQQADDLGWLRWPARTALWGPVVLRGDEIPIPAEDRVGAGDGGDFAQGLTAERLGESGEAAALRVRQANAPAKLFDQEAVLRLQVLDRPVLVARNPGPDPGGGELKRHGGGRSSEQPVPNTPQPHGRQGRRPALNRAIFARICRSKSGTRRDCVRRVRYVHGRGQ
jgi:hypothetical protein